MSQSSVESEIGMDETERNWLLTLLHPQDAEQAAARLDTLRRRLQMYFTLQRGSDPEELAQRTLTRVVARLKAGMPLNVSLESLCQGFAEKVLQEERRAQWKQRQQVPLDDPTGAGETILPARPGDQEEELYRQECIAYLRRWLATLSEEDCQIVLGYYDCEDWGAGRIRARKALADKFGLSPDALKNRVLRLRKKLTDCKKKDLGEK